jgi:predicted nuclease with TOPRIM domain
LEEKVKDVVDESEKLKNTLIGKDGVINAIESELNAVKDVTSGYATLRETLGNLMGDYENLGKFIDETVRKTQ